jgi:uncharacterized protein YndB with AHSA1/START domain
MTNSFTIEKKYKASAADVFAAFADPDALAKWWGPVGFEITVLAFDFRPGGRFHYKMQSNEHIMYGLFQYLEIQTPNRIVWNNSFADADGQIVPAPFLDSFPLQITNTVELSESNGITRLTIHARPVTDDTDEMQGFESLLGSMQQGYGGTLNQLTFYLQTIPYIKTKILPASMETVWSVLTEEQHLAQWYFDFKGQFKPILNHEFEWFAGEPGGKEWLHRGKITELIPGVRIVHTWEYPGYAGLAQVTWQLTKIDEQQTQLEFRFDFVFPFEPTEPALEKINFITGWDYFLHQALEDYVLALKKMEH